MKGNAVINGVFIKEDRLLLCQKNWNWILPWWKIDDWDITDYRTLAREVQEELSWAKINPYIDFFWEYTWITPTTRRQITTRVYIAKIFGNKEPKASQEITDAQYFADPLNLQLSDITREIVKNLISNGYLTGKNKI